MILEIERRHTGWPLIIAHHSCWSMVLFEHIPKVETFQTRRQGSGRKSSRGAGFFWGAHFSCWLCSPLVPPLLFQVNVSFGQRNLTTCLPSSHSGTQVSPLQYYWHLSQVMWWGLSCACQDIQQHLTGLYWLDAHSVPILITKNCFWTLPNVPLENKITPRWE